MRAVEFASHRCVVGYAGMVDGRRWFLRLDIAPDRHGANDQQRPGCGLWDRRQRCQGQGGAARTVVGSRQKVETQGILAVPDDWRKEICPYLCEGVRTGGGSDSRAPTDDAVAEHDGGKPVEVVEYRKKIDSGSLAGDPPLLAISNVSVKPGAVIVPSSVTARAAGASIIEAAMIAASTPSRIALSGFLAAVGKPAGASLRRRARTTDLLSLNGLTPVPDSADNRPHATMRRSAYFSNHIVKLVGYPQALARFDKEGAGHRPEARFRSEPENFVDFPTRTADARTIEVVRTDESASTQGFSRTLAESHVSKT